MSDLRRESKPPTPLPLAFRVDGEPMVLTDRRTTWWVRALAAEPPGCWWQAIPGSLRESDQDRLLHRLLDDDDDFDLDDLESTAELVLTDALGINLWAGHQIARIVYANWMLFDGWCASHGFDPWAAPIGRVLAAGYTWRIGLCEKKSEVSQVDSQVWGPPPARTASGRLRDQAPIGWNDDKESDAFMSALNLS